MDAMKKESSDDAEEINSKSLEKHEVRLFFTIAKYLRLGSVF